MNKKYLITILFFLGLVLLIFFIIDNGRGPEEVTYKSNEIRLLEKDNLGYIFWVAENKEYFDDNIEFLRVSSPGEDDFSKWLVDNVDIAILSLDELLVVGDEFPGAFTTLFYVHDNEAQYTTNIVTASDKNIKGINELEGKVIGVDSRIEEFLLIKYLESNSIENYEINRTLRANQGASLKSGIIDAAWATEPFGTKMELEGIGVKLVKNPNNNPVTQVSLAPFGAIVISNSFSEREPQKAENIKKSLGKSLNISEAGQREIMIDHLDESWKKIVENRTFAEFVPAESINKNLIQYITDEMKKYKFIK